MTSNQDIARRWVDVVEGREARNFNDAWNNIKTETDRIYSWGRHFEMARPLRDAKGRITGYLINGDRASVSTDRHQSEVRNAIASLGSAPSVTIPYEALDAAGIDRDTVRVLEVREDRWETTEHSSAYLSQVPERLRDRAVDYTRRESWQWEAAWHDDDGVYHWETKRHWLGGSLIRARVTWRETQRCDYCHGQQMEGPERQNAYCGKYPPRCWECDGRGAQTVTRHRWATFLSGFDEQETRPSYFFCELPARSKARTIDEAYEALKPEPVKLAEAMGRPVTRQGDIFAVPTTYTKAQLRKLGATFERMSEGREEVDLGWRGKRIEYGEAAQLLGTNHRATEVARLGGVTLARGVLWHKPEGRDPDHKRQPMGDRKSWHVIVKNTVPVAA